MSDVMSPLRVDFVVAGVSGVGVSVAGVSVAGVSVAGVLSPPPPHPESANVAITATESNVFLVLIKILCILMMQL
jgi:hypothetical protein